MDVRRSIPDPRTARGNRDPWIIVVTVLAAGLAHGQQTAHASAQGVGRHAAARRAARPDRVRLPRRYPQAVTTAWSVWSQRYVLPE